MSRTSGVRKVAALVAGTCLVVSACSSSEGAKSGDYSPKSGGTLQVLNSSEIPTWDPQRNSSASVYAFAIRTFWRTLTTTDPISGELVGDLAEGTGTASKDGKTWTFNLRDGVKWQDGEPLVCQDIRYGISRTFANDQITGGSQYAVRYLDIPTDADGKSVYKGPYKKTGQDQFEKAIECDSNTITFHLKAPHFDFNQTAATSGFTAFRADQDKGSKSNYTVFSSGPYMLKGSWSSGKGGTFVRNPSWSPDPDPVRKAYPDEIVFKEGLPEDTAVQRIIANSGADKNSITYSRVSPAQQPVVMGDPNIKGRTAFIQGTGVDFLLPNFKSSVMNDPKVRQALAMSTDRGAYAQAYGGETLYQPTFDVLTPSLLAHTDWNPFGTPLDGDAAAAKAVLESSTHSVPVPITVTYKKDSTSDKAFALLAEGWKEAGFDVKLDGISQNYYSAIASPSIATKSDVFWTTWGISWPSAGTVLPNNFDSRINLTETGTGLDNGYFDNSEINDEMDRVALIPSYEEREKAWGEISEKIAKLGGYVALTSLRYMYPTGSGVQFASYEGGGLAGQVDIATAAVK